MAARATQTKEKAAPATVQIKKRGRHKYGLRKWLEEQIPKLPNVSVEKEVEHFIDHPTHGRLSVMLPNSWVVIPLDMIEERNAANVTQTARNAAKTVKVAISTHAFEIMEFNVSCYAIERQ